MNIIYPIRAVLIYLAMQFAPLGVDRIKVEGPGIEAAELIREGDAWKSGDDTHFSVEDEKLKIRSGSEEEILPVDEFLPPLKGHNWSENPVVSILDGTIKKTDGGFTLEQKAGDSDANGESIKTFSILYSASAPPTPKASVGEIRVNVLGEVRSPGVYKVPANGSLIDAIAAAGGFGEKANAKRVSIVRGSTGKIPTVTEFDVNSMLHGDTPTPPLEDRDTINVGARVF